MTGQRIRARELDIPRRKLLISFSGGETSAYMTQWLFRYNRQVRRWDRIVVVFANTGQEHEETLEFVKACDEHFGFNTVWLEAVQFHGQRALPHFKIVNFETADRQGIPFEEEIKKYGIPNYKYKDCTRNLKQRPIEAYAKSIGLDNYELAIGIRVDELDRVSPNAKQRNIIYPLARINPRTKAQINTWWRAQPFRLNLEHWQGNCKWCWKKTKRKHLTIIKYSPEDFDFPRRMEEEYGLVGPEFKHTENEGRKPLPAGYRRTFFRDNKSVKDLFKEYQEKWYLLEDYHDDANVYDEELDVGGACSDSCEVFSDEDWQAKA